MKKVSKFAALTMLLFAVTLCGAAEKTTTPLNLVRGAVGPFNANNNWSNYSVVTLIPGASLIPVTSTQTVLYLGFGAGSEADITNMVLYTTVRGSTTITAVTPVTYGGSSSPSIMLSSASVCPQPPSLTSVCIVRLDPTPIVLSATNDYYFAVYFTSDSNNSGIGAAQPQYGLWALESWYVSGTNETTLTVGQSIPNNSFRVPDFLMYVMTD